MKNTFLSKETRHPSGYWSNKENILIAIDHMVNDMINKNIIKSYEEIVNITANNFREYGLKTIMKLGIINLINMYSEYKLGYKFNEWQFRSTRNNYWDDTNNIIKAIKWMLKEKEKWNINDTDWLIENYNSKLFKKHKLTSIFDCFYKSNINLIDNNIIGLLYLTYPNLKEKLFVWEFNQTGNNYWTKENADIALKQLIEKKIKINNINDIPKIINKSFFKYMYGKFMTPLNEIYKGNIFNWINSIYPNQFTCRDFGYIECSDGTIVKSCSEQIIHNYLISEYNNVIYLKNIKDNQGVYYEEDKFVPDWLVNDKYVIEYLGLTRSKDTGDNRINIYNEKVNKKINMAKNNKNYIFIFVYEKDLFQNLYELKNKLSIIK